MLVLGSSFLITFLGWEGVGLCSYLLVSFWFERNAAAVAGKKAFVTNRVGDVGFLLAMFLIFASYGSLDYSAMAAGAHAIRQRHRDRDRTAAPRRRDRQERAVPAAPLAARRDGGPHAGLGADPRRDHGHRGVFLLCRAHPFLEASGDAMTVVAWVGGVTALLAGTVAIIAARHQTRARVLHRQPARLHVPRASASTRTPPPSSW